MHLYHLKQSTNGGTAEKRARLLVEIISQIKQQIEDFPVLVRLDANEYRIENGITPADFLITASMAQEAGADAIDVSAYGNTSKGIAFTEAPLVHEPGGFLDFVKMAKKELTIPGFHWHSNFINTLFTFIHAVNSEGSSPKIHAPI